MLYSPVGLIPLARAIIFAIFIAPGPDGSIGFA
jgi:hypothetical protein